MTNLNWKDIRKEYPKAYAKLMGDGAESQVWVCAWRIGHPVSHIDDDDQIWNDSELYKFFDSQKLYCSVEPSFDGNGEMQHFNACLSCKAPSTSWGAAHYLMQGHETRLEAEEDAYLKAFEILETWLNGQEYTKD